MLFTAAHLHQLVGHVQRRDHRDAVGTDDLAGVADLAHLAIEVLGGIQQVGALLGGTGDVILLLQYAHADARTRSGRSCALLHGVQAADHGLDPRAHLLVLLQQRCALGGDGVLTLAQRAILLLELPDGGDQFVEALLEPLEFQFDPGGVGVCFMGKYRATLSQGSIAMRVR